jgi:preprotein translocase subunit SecG
MTAVLLLIHLFVTLALIGVVLIQRSEGGGLGIGTSQGMGSFMSGRGTANLLTRATAILGTLFFALSLALALLNKGTTGTGHSLLDLAPATAKIAPAPAPAAPAPGTAGPAAPAPAVPPAAPKPPAPGVPVN